MGEQGLFAAQMFCNVFWHNLSISKFSNRGRRYIQSLQRESSSWEFHRINLGLTILKTKIPSITIRIDQNQNHIPPKLLKGKDSTLVILNTIHESQN